MKMGLLQVALHHREWHSSSSVLGSENEFSVSLAGQGRHWEAAHLLERPQGALRNRLRLGCPLGMGIGIAFRHYSLAGVMEASLRYPLLHWIYHRRGLVLLGPCPCLLARLLLPCIHPCLPALLPLLRTFDEESSAFGVNATSRGLPAP